MFAAFLNAAFGICLGCQLYPLVAPAAPHASPPEPCNISQQSKGYPSWLAPTSWSPPTGPRAISTHPNIVFVEVDEDTSAYDAGHIAGAVKLDWKTDLQDPVKRDFVDAAAVLEAARRHAASPTTTPWSSTAATTTGSPPTRTGTSSCTATRTSSCSTAAARSGSSTAARCRPTPSSRPATSYTAKAPDNSIRAFRDEVIAAIGTKNLVDVRSPDEFSGKILAPAHLPQEQSQRPGHIPGAINVPWSKAANEDGTFKSDEDLAKLYAEAGLDGEKETIAYCRIGERSSHTWFVLQELLGHQNVKNYDGSWTEYGSLVGAPIELGS